MRRSAAVSGITALVLLAGCDPAPAPDRGQAADHPAGQVVDESGKKVASILWAGDGKIYYTVDGGKVLMRAATSAPPEELPLHLPPECADGVYGLAQAADGGLAAMANCGWDFAHSVEKTEPVVIDVATGSGRLRQVPHWAVDVLWGGGGRPDWVRYGAEGCQTMVRLRGDQPDLGTGEFQRIARPVWLPVLDGRGYLYFFGGRRDGCDAAASDPWSLVAVAPDGSFTTLGEFQYPTGLAADGGGRLAVAAVRDGTSGIWELRPGQGAFELRHAGDYCGLSFSPDGASLAAAVPELHASVLVLPMRPDAAAPAAPVASPASTPDSRSPRCASDPRPNFD
ncbi:hypothetical protein [Catellatospora sp. TT07R-123]|uniref:hypothetical protein n=1 Tax=Catellatospora sp. TT07R-123 TaxID=2733863 RepID=UPI001BB40EED|nr:hypothetical protein [Catellatospora sp. TT07R-123]